MKGFLKELQESNATGAVQVVRTLSGSVKQPELDGYADKEIFSVHGKGKLLWAEVSEAFNRLPSQSGTQTKMQLFIDGKLQANIKGIYYGSSAGMYLQMAPPESFVGLGNYGYLPTRITSFGGYREINVFSCSEVEHLVPQNSNDYQRCCYFPIAAYIPFKESVEIRVSNTFVKNSDTYAEFNCGVGYLLDED